MSKHDLTQGSVPKTLARLTAPMVMGVSSSILVQTLEMGFIGQLSTRHVAAITFTFPLTMILTSIALGISIGTSSVVARSVGQGEPSAVRRLGTHSLILTAVSMAILSLLGWLMIDPVFTLLGADAAMLVLIHSYLDIYYPSVVLFTVTMIASSLLRANGHAGVPGTIMTVGALFNLAIDPILIFGWFGLPKMELAGAATAMALSRVATSIALLGYVFRYEFVELSDVWRGFIASSRRILHVGIPAMATQLIGPVSAAVVTRMLAGYGEVVVAGFGVATRIEALAVMLFFALSGSIGPFVGQNIAAKKGARVRLGLRVSYQFCIVWGFAMAVLMYFAGGTIASWMDDNPEVVLIAGFYLMLVPWSHGLWGVLMTASASFNAVGKPLPSTIMSFTRMFVVYIPLALLLESYWGYEGIFMATLASNSLLGLAAYFWFKAQVSHRVRATTA